MWGSKKTVDIGRQKEFEFESLILFLAFFMRQFQFWFSDFSIVCMCVLYSHKMTATINYELWINFCDSLINDDFFLCSSYYIIYKVINK